MKRNQKHTQEEMYMAIELWKGSGLSQKRYCSQNHLAFSTFKYWLKKYQKEKRRKAEKPVESFIPVHIPRSIDTTPAVTDTEPITITYPNGIKVSCPVNIGLVQLRGLITL